MASGVTRRITRRLSVWRRLLAQRIVDSSVQNVLRRKFCVLSVIMFDLWHFTYFSTSFPSPFACILSLELPLKEGKAKIDGKLALTAEKKEEEELSFKDSMTLQRSSSQGSTY